MSDADWEPLSDAVLAQRPGEAADAVARPLPATAAASLGSAPAPAATATATTATATAIAARTQPRAAAAPDPAAERALAALKARIANAGPADSLIAAVQHREQRDQRRQAAVHAPELTAALVTAPATPPEVAIDAYASDLDPRELEPWFRELPLAEQARLRATWFEERHRHDDRWRVCRRRLGRAACHGALLFAAMGIALALLMGGFHLVLPLAVGGAIAAVAAEACGGGRFGYALAGSLAFVVLLGPSVFVQPFSLCAVLLASYGMGAIGMDGEMRRSAGFGDRDPPVKAPPPAPRS